MSIAAAAAAKRPIRCMILLGYGIAAFGVGPLLDRGGVKLSSVYGRVP
jgi:hypothetical protein